MGHSLIVRVSAPRPFMPCGNSGARPRSWHTRDVALTLSSSQEEPTDTGWPFSSRLTSSFAGRQSRARGHSPVSQQAVSRAALPGLWAPWGEAPVSLLRGRGRGTVGGLSRPIASEATSGCPRVWRSCWGLQKQGVSWADTVQPPCGSLGRGIARRGKSLGATGGFQMSIWLLKASKHIMLKGHVRGKHN